MILEKYLANYRNAYETLEIVNRSVNMIVDDVAEIPFSVGEKVVGANNIYKKYSPIKSGFTTQ